MPTVASTTLSRSFAPVAAATGNPSQTESPTSSSTSNGPQDSNADKRKGVPMWVPIVCGVGGGVILLILALLLWRYWRRRAKFERGRGEGGEGARGGEKDEDKEKGHNGLAWRRGDSFTVWPVAAESRPRDRNDEARRNNPYLQQQNRRSSSSSSSSRSSGSSRSSRSSHAHSDMSHSDSASDAEIITRASSSAADPSMPGGKASSQEKLQNHRGVTNTSPRASYEYNNARPSSPQSSHSHTHGQWGSVYPLGSKAVPVSVGVNMMRNTSDASGRSGKVRSRRRNTGSTFLHPRKAPRPGQKGRRVEESDEYSVTEEEDDDGRSTDETAEVSLKSPVAFTYPHTNFTHQKQVAFATQPGGGANQGSRAAARHPEMVSPRSVPPSSFPVAADNRAADKTAASPFAKSPLDYSSASSHTGSPRAQINRNVGQGERASRLIITNARPGEVPVDSSPDTAAPPGLLPAVAVARAREKRGSGPSPLRQDTTVAHSKGKAAHTSTTSREAVRSPGASSIDSSGNGKSQSKSAWRQLKDKTRDKVKERTGRKGREAKDGGKSGVAKEKNRRDGEGKEKEKKSKSGKMRKTRIKQGGDKAGKASSTAGSKGIVASPNPSGLPVLGRTSKSDKHRVDSGLRGSRDSFQTLVRYHSPELMSSLPPDHSHAPAQSAAQSQPMVSSPGPISPSSIYTHRTSHHHVPSTQPFAAELHTKEPPPLPLPAFVNQPLPLPPGAKRTSPLRPRKSVHSGTSTTRRGNPHASILGTQAGWARVLGGRGSPSRMSASATAVVQVHGHGQSGAGERKGEPIGSGSRSASPKNGTGGEKLQIGTGRSLGYPGSIDFSLPPTTPTHLPPLPDLPAHPHAHATAHGPGPVQAGATSAMDMAYRGHSEYSEFPAAPALAPLSDAHSLPVPASLPSTKESHQQGDAYEPVDRSALHFAIARTGMAFESDAEGQLDASFRKRNRNVAADDEDEQSTSGRGTDVGMESASALTPVPRDTFGANGVGDNEQLDKSKGKERKGMPRDSEYRAAAYRSTQGRQGERSSLAPTLPSLYEPKSAAPRWEAGDSMPSTPVKDKLDRMNRI